MKDKNGVEMKTGDVVRITGAYYDNDNGLWFVDNSPGDPTWGGEDYSLAKLQKSGKLSTARHNICFWPLSVEDSDKEEEIRAWNEGHAQIEVLPDFEKKYIEEYFRNLADSMAERLDDWGGSRMNWGPDSSYTRMRIQQEHYLEVADRLKEGE